MEHYSLTYNLVLQFKSFTPFFLNRPETDIGEELHCRSLTNRQKTKKKQKTRTKLSIK